MTEKAGMTVDVVVAFLETEAKAVFDNGVFHQDEFGMYSATERESGVLEQAAEVLRDRYIREEDTS